MEEALQLITEGGTRMPRGSNAHVGALFIATAAPSDIIPFHLPDTRADRQLRIDFGTSHWNLTSSFPADVAQEYQLKVTRAIDLRLLKHVSTRASPQYKVELPPRAAQGKLRSPWDGELGVWFETDWEDGHIIVKGTKRVRVDGVLNGIIFTSRHTSIHDDLCPPSFNHSASGTILVQLHRYSRW